MKLKHILSQKSIQTLDQYQENQISFLLKQNKTKVINEKYADFGSQQFIKKLKLKNIQQINRRGSKTIDRYFRSLKQKQLKKQFQKQTSSYSHYLISKVSFKQNQQTQQFISQINKKEQNFNIRNQKYQKIKNYLNQKNIYQANQGIQSANKPFQQLKQSTHKNKLKLKTESLQKKVALTQSLQKNVLIQVNQNKDIQIQRLLQKKQRSQMERQTYQTYQANKQYRNISEQYKKQVLRLKQQIQQQKQIIELQSEIIQKHELKLKQMIMQINQLQQTETTDEKLTFLPKYQLFQDQSQQKHNCFQFEQLFDWESKLNILKKQIENSLNSEANYALKDFGQTHYYNQNQKLNKNAQIKFNNNQFDQNKVQASALCPNHLGSQQVSSENINNPKNQHQIKNLLVYQNQFKAIQ